MRVIYLSTSYVPFRRADSVHVMKMCQALGAAGFDVTLTTKRSPKYVEKTSKTDFEFYGVKEIFRIKKVWRPVFKGGDLIFTVLTLLYVISRRGSTDVIFSRSNFLAVLTGFLNIPLIYEMHGMPFDTKSEKAHQKIINLKNLKSIVVISEALKNDLVEHSPTVADKVIVAHDGADLNPDMGSKESNERLQVGYVGHLYSGRGIELILECAENLPDFDFNIIGGEEKDIEHFKNLKKLINVRFYGFVSPGELKSIYTEQDVLLMPYQRKVGIASGTLDTSRWMSPMKMFEYMATGKAIISSDLPVLKEVLKHDHNAVLVSPDNPQEWIDELKELSENTTRRIELGENARKDLLEQYTWEARARSIMTFFKSRF